MTKVNERAPLKARQEALAFGTAMGHKRALLIEFSKAVRADKLYQAVISDTEAARFFDQLGDSLHRVFDLSRLLEGHEQRGDISLKSDDADSSEEKAASN
jgi:hypothetical protein